jgi:cytochrome c
VKKIVFYGLVVMLLFSLVQFNISNAFAGEIDYKMIFEYECQKCHERDGKGQRGERN